ncbi:MAG: hypothetical protein L0H93_21315 [Nocardioides sp.]|nr:hypothetical protein [Nocardioides sp.]
MAQNSWDARSGNRAVRFTINLRLLGDDEVKALRSMIFTGDATGLRLGESLNKAEVWALEIADRGTKGLGGPVRNDVAVRPDQVTDFADLIFTLGAPRDVNLGAGTYGFGKTVAYRASACGTVLFWSRSREEHGIEDRVIGSAFGPAFDRDGLVYTGRHWWGTTAEDRIEPIRGQDADALANSVFDQGFDEGETGTSMLVLDPDLGIGSPQETADSIAAAALWHLWPKMVEAGAGRTQMLVETLLNGEAVSPVTPRDHSLFAGFSDCLHQVRSVQSGGSYTPLFNTSTHEVWLGKPRTLLGHLALTRYPFRAEASLEDDIAVFPGPAHHVALMRHDAELVVKYVQGEALNSPGFQWAGVFKPVADTDNSFAEAEPPAHDDWCPAAIVDKTKRRQVNVALREIKSLVADFLGPVNIGAANQATGRSVAALADELAGLMGGVHGPAPVRPPSKPGAGGSTSRRASATVRKTWSGPIANGRRLMALQVAVDGSTQPVRVRVDAGVGVEGAMDHDESRVAVLGWVPGGEVPDLTVEPVTTEPELIKGQPQWVLVDADSQVSIDVNLRVGGEQA